jgi:hypothetical protein
VPRCGLAHNCAEPIGVLKAAYSAKDAKSGENLAEGRSIWSTTQAEIGSAEWETGSKNLCQTKAMKRLAPHESLGAEDARPSCGMVDVVRRHFQY